MVIVGRDVVSGLPIEMEITAEVIYAAIKDNLNSICNSIKMILEKTPPELAKDIIHSGIYITGGGSKIHNLDKLFTEITNIKVNSCENPEECAVRGLNKIVSDEKYKHLGFSMKSKMRRRPKHQIPTKYILLSMTALCILAMYVSFSLNLGG